jgi:hypothetical protein
MRDLDQSHESEATTMMRPTAWLRLAAFAAALAPFSAAAQLMPPITVSNPTGANISYSSAQGPIMAGRVNVYIVWYGSFPSWSSTQSLITYFISNWGASHSYGVLRSYADSTGARVAPQLALAGQYIDGAASIGTSVSDSQIQTYINSALTAKPVPIFPVDSNGIYLFIVGTNISVSRGNGSLCGDNSAGFCGYHSREGIAGTTTTVKYALVGGASCFGCPSYGKPSPNGNSFADATVNVIAHEAAEIVTDPYNNAWGTGESEVGDLCNWDFSEQYHAPNGTYATAQVGANYYMIQKLWSPTNGGGCYSGYSPPAALIWQEGPGGQIGAWQMQDQGTISSYLYYPSIPTGQTVLAVGDFSNGIDPQLLTIGSSPGPLTMWTLHNDQTATAATFSALPFVDWYSGSNNIVGTADVDGDGYGDILAVNPSQGDVWLYFMQGTTLKASQYIGNYLPWRPVATADVNGDGLADIVWVDATDQIYGVWTSYLSQGVVKFAIWPTVRLNGTILAVGDLNGDARADVLYKPIGNAMSADEFVFSGANLTTRAISLGNPERPYIPPWAGLVDANRDGTLDLYAQTASGLNIVPTLSWKTSQSLGSNIVWGSRGPTFGDSGWQVVGIGGFKEF